MAEALYVVEGDFTNEGKQYKAGSSLHFKAGNVHGPHTTKNGCRLVILWTERPSKAAADLSDFVVVKQSSIGRHRVGHADLITAAPTRNIDTQPFIGTCDVAHCGSERDRSGADARTRGARLQERAGRPGCGNGRDEAAHGSTEELVVESSRMVLEW